jgi:type VI protein secretion system component VasF
MSKTAIRTVFCTLFIVLVVFAFGHGYNLGHKSQLTMQGALDIGKANYKCEMVKR